jgi:hypothetical protein
VYESRHRRGRRKRLETLNKRGIDGNSPSPPSKSRSAKTGFFALKTLPLILIASAIGTSPHFLKKKNRSAFDYR